MLLLANVSRGEKEQGFFVTQEQVEKMREKEENSVDVYD
jgi:hypothetical protein